MRSFNSVFIATYNGSIVLLAGGPVHISHYEQSQTSVVAFDLSSFGKLVLKGKDRTAFLQNFTTNDVVKAGAGFGCETFLTSPQAKVVAWLRVAVLEHDLYLNMEPQLCTRVIQHLEKYVIGEDVQFEDRTTSDFLWLISGPKTLPLMDTLDLRFHDWKLWQNAQVKYQDKPFWVQRCDYLGQPSAFVWGDRSDMEIMHAFLTDQQVPLLSIDEPLWTTLRAEAATPCYGIDIDETYLPQEVNRTEQCISFTKGCYIGQETVARIRAYGHVNRQLVRLKFVEPVENPAAWSGAIVKTGEKEVGKLKTVAWSPQANAVLALGLIRKEHLAPGTALAAIQPGSEGKRSVVTI